MSPAKRRGSWLRDDSANAPRYHENLAFSRCSSFCPRLGVVYLCFGEKYRALTEISVCSLRSFGYVGPIRIVTSSSTWNLNRFGCEIVRVPFRGLGFATRYYKTRINQYGFDTTLFLDADTLPIATIRPIWRELRFGEICLCLDIHRQVRDLIKVHLSDRKRCLPEYYLMGELELMRHPLYSSGVMLFHRNISTDRLFEAWHEEWNRFGQEDQLALVRALARTELTVHLLGPRWNGWQGRFDSLGHAQESGIRILHNVRKVFDPSFLESRSGASWEAAASG